MGSHSSDNQHRLLLWKYEDWFQKVSKGILTIVPQAQEIWCHGLVALDPSMRGGRRTWEFVALMPKGTNAALIASLNDFNSALDLLQSVEGRSVEVQTALNDRNAKFNKVMMYEGFAIWRNGAQVYAEEYLKTA